MVAQDASEGLWYRDCTFIGAKDANGRPIFWARGNGPLWPGAWQGLSTLALQPNGFMRHSRGLAGSQIAQLTSSPTTGRIPQNQTWPNALASGWTQAVDRGNNRLGLYTVRA